MALLDDLGYTCTGLPDEADWPSLVPIIAIARVGGGIDTEGITDTASMTVVSIDESRPKAWETAIKVRRRIADAGATEVNGILIDSTEEDVGVVQQPDLNPDNRFVEMTFRVSCRAQ